MRLDVEKILSRHKKAEEERIANRGVLESVYNHVMPWRNSFENQSKSLNTPVLQYDSTAMIAANNFVNTMQSKFTPVFTQWAEMKAGPMVPEKARKLFNKRLKNLTDTVFTYLDASNFNTAVSEAYFDLGVGTMALMVLEGDANNPLQFVPIPISQLSIEDGPFGSVSATYRKHKMACGLVKQQWKTAKLPQELADMANDKPREEVELLEACYWCAKDLVWHYDIVYEKTKDRIYTVTFKEQPIIVARWMKIPGFAMGVGPFMLANADYKTLDKMKEMMLKTAALNAFGVYTVKNKGALNQKTVTIRPSQFIPVESNSNTDPSIRRLPDAGNYQVQEFMMEDLKNSIRQIMLDNRLPPSNAPIRTAFEISERIKELSSDIGASFGRLMFEFVQPLFRRIVFILERKGLIELPEEFDIDNQMATINVISPVAQQQKAEDVNKLMQAFQLSSAINPQLALMTYEIEKIPAWIAEKYGVDANLVRDEKAVQDIKTQIEALIQQTQGQPNEQPAG